MRTHRKARIRIWAALSIPWLWAVTTPVPLSHAASACLPAGIDAFDYRAYAKVECAFDLLDDLPGEDLFDLRTALFFEGKVRFSDRFAALLSTLGRFELYADGETHTFKDLDLYEAYGELNLRRFDLRVGKQIVTWGRTEIISPLNNLNPRDLRGAFNPEAEDLRLPVLMGRLDAYFGAFVMEVVYIPFFEPSPFHLYGSDFAALKQLDLVPPPSRAVEALVDLGLFPDIGSLLDIPDELWSRVEPALLSTDWPRDDFVEGGEAGIRLTWSGRGFDVSASYLYTRWDTPTIRLSPRLIDLINEGSITLPATFEIIDLINTGEAFYRSSYDRLHILGVDLSTSIDQVTVNAEAAWLLDRTYTNDDFAPVRSPVFFYTVSLDTFLMGSCFLLGQFFHSIVVESGDRPLLLYDRHTVGVVGALRASFLDDALQGELAGLWLLNSGDVVVSPRLSYQVNDHLSISAGLNLFEGDGLGSGLALTGIESYTLVGHVDNNDQIFISLKYSL